jgi:predicted N-acetyltransferase YhbS
MNYLVRPAVAHDLPRINALKAGAYGASGYGSSPEEVHLGEHDIILVAEFDGAGIVGTISGKFYRDGIPYHHVFRDELLRIRARSKRMVHCGSFAVCRQVRQAGIRSIGLALIGEMVVHTCAKLVDTVTIIVNPGHVGFYLRLGFTQVAETEVMPGLTNAPAVLLAVNGTALQGLYQRKANGTRMYTKRGDYPVARPQNTAITTDQLYPQVELDNKMIAA